jgi:hypothetical protein
VQISAAKMIPENLKKDFGHQFTFWGGGVNTQKTLPFGTPDEVREEVRQLIKTFKPNGGFVFATVHNVQAYIPVENLLSLFEAINDIEKRKVKLLAGIAGIFAPGKKKEVGEMLNKISHRGPDGRAFFRVRRNNLGVVGPTLYEPLLSQWQKEKM